MIALRIVQSTAMHVADWQQVCRARGGRVSERARRLVLCTTSLCVDKACCDRVSHSLLQLKALLLVTVLCVQHSTSRMYAQGG